MPVSNSSGPEGTSLMPSSLERDQTHPQRRPASAARAALPIPPLPLAGRQSLAEPLRSCFASAAPCAVPVLFQLPAPGLSASAPSCPFLLQCVTPHTII